MKKSLASLWSFDFLIEVLILLVVFLLPTIFDRRLGIVFSGTKIAWLRAAGVVILSLWALKIIIAGKHRFFRTPLDWPIVSFLLCTTVAALTSVHVYTSLVGFYGRYEGLSTWYLFGLLFFVVTNFMRSQDQMKRIFMAVICASTLMSVYSILQRHLLDPYMWGGVVTWQRVIGTIGQPNFLAAYMLMAFFLGLAMFLFEEQKDPAPIALDKQLLPVAGFVGSVLVFLFMIYVLDAQDVYLWYFGFAIISALALLFTYTYQKLYPLFLNIILGLSLLLAYVSILYTQSRGGYMGLFTGLVIFVLLAGRQVIFANWRKIVILGCFITLVSALTMMDPQFSPLSRFTSEVTTTKDAGPIEDEPMKLELKGAAGSRGETWKSAFQIMADYPIFGVGPEVLKMVFPRYETDLFRFKEAFHVKQDRCHNETFDVAVTKGFFAFVVYLWLLFLFFTIGWRKAKGGDVFIAGLLGAGLAYLIQNQFSFGVVAITSLFWIIWAMVMSYRGKEEEKEQEKGKKNDILSFQIENIPWFYVSIVLVLASVLIYFSFFSFRADIYFKSGKSLLGAQQFEQGRLDLDKSLAVLPFEGGTISHLAIAYLNLANHNPADKALVQKAVDVLQYGTKVDPYNADNFYMLAKVNLVPAMSGSKPALVLSKQYAELAIKLDPYYAEVYQVLGMLAEKEGDLEKALGLYEKSFFINPNLDQPMRDLERVLILRGEPDKILEVYGRAVKKYGDNLVVLERTARAYLTKGRIPEALKLANRMVRINQQAVAEAKQASPYLVRGLVAIAAGDKPQAFADFQEAILIEPKNIEAHLLLGRVYIMNGNTARAKEEFEQVLMMDKNNAQAKSWLGQL